MPFAYSVFNQLVDLGRMSLKASEKELGVTTVPLVLHLDVLYAQLFRSQAIDGYHANTVLALVGKAIQAGKYQHPGASWQLLLMRIRAGAA
jgi:hypothetical protein